MPDRSPLPSPSVIDASSLLWGEAFWREAEHSGGLDVVVGLSGGVDSAAAAALLLDAGLRVGGLLLNIPGAASPREDAVAVAEALKIPLWEADVSTAFRQIVLRDFADEYRAGRTPNPCIRCNPGIKFAALCEMADRLGAPRIATGHYARLSREGAGASLLRHQSAKDQSYMLCRLTAAQRARLLLPLAPFTKEEARRIAAARGLAVSSKKDSQDICFVPEGHHAEVLRRLGVPMEEGDFVDCEGRPLGRHKGIGRYTLGQRKGLGVSAAGRLFVLGMDVTRNTVTLGQREQLLTDRLTLGEVMWQDEPPACSFAATVKLRLGPKEHPAAVLPLEDGAVELRFDPPVTRAAAGQSAVIYDGERMVGAGIVR